MTALQRWEIDLENQPKNLNKLERDLLSIRDDVLRLSHMAVNAVERATLALRKLDLELARQVNIEDDDIDQTRYRIEEACYHLLAMQQPTARDMRAIVTAIHLVVELERIADHANGIASLTLQLAHHSPVKIPDEIFTMSSKARKMITGSITAYLEWDAGRAKEIYLQDDEMDALEKSSYHILLESMIREPDKISPYTYLLWISHNLERIGDRVTNICERVMFMVTGIIQAGRKLRGPDSSAE